MATAVDLFKRDERVAIVMADISLDYLRPAVEHDPRRAVNAGIMEQSAVGIAAGFALEGFHPIVHTLAPFLTERPLEQIKLDFGYQGLGGTFISAGAAYDYGESGGTHHAAGDIQALGSIPRARGARARVGAARPMRCFARATRTAGRRTSARASSRTASRSSSRPAASRSCGAVPTLTVIAAGPFLSRTLDALDGVDATVLYATTLVPLDAETLAREAAPSTKVVLVEPAYEGTSAAQIAAALSHRPTQLLSIGVPRQFIERYGTSARARRRARARRARDPRADPELSKRCLTPRVSDTRHYSFVSNAPIEERFPAPAVMGVINVTPDSFSDGGVHFNVEPAVTTAWGMFEAGAAIVDVGGESTRPGSTGVSAEEELERVEPVLADLAGAPVSIDTSKAAVARRALELGVELVNDVTALRADPELAGCDRRRRVLCLPHAHAWRAAARCRRIRSMTTSSRT